VRIPILSFAQNQIAAEQRTGFNEAFPLRNSPRLTHTTKSAAATARDLREKPMLQSRTVSEIYSPTLEAAFKFILEDPTISSSVERVSFQFITAARFLKNDAPHLFQLRIAADPLLTHA
jgi:2-methylcitrate dehydratase PrpD